MWVADAFVLWISYRIGRMGGVNSSPQAWALHYNTNMKTQWCLIISIHEVTLKQNLFFCTVSEWWAETCILRSLPPPTCYTGVDRLFQPEKRVSLLVSADCLHLRSALISVSDRASCLFIYIFCMYAFPNVPEKIDLIFVCTLLLIFVSILYFLLFSAKKSIM